MERHSSDSCSSDLFYLIVLEPDVLLCELICQSADLTDTCVNVRTHGGCQNGSL